MIRSNTARLALLAGLTTLAVATSASAQVTADEAKCRSAIAKVSGKYIKAIGKAVTACHKGRDAGSVGAMVDCNDVVESDLKGSVAKIAEGAAAAIGKSCAATPAVLAEFGRCPIPAETVDDAVGLTGIDDFNELTACLLEHARLVTSDAAHDIMGNPTLPISDSLASCHAAIGKAYTKYIDTTIKVRAKCQKAADKAGGALGFECATADPDGKIDASRVKAKEAIVNACASAAPLGRGARAAELASLGACADEAAALADCAIDEESTAAAGGTAAMMWELPGTCPGSGAATVSSSSGSTEVDAGFRGLAHDMDPILGYRSVIFDVTCDPDCGNCGASTAHPAPEACRCNEDNSLVCSDNADCTTGCQCFYGPPTPYAAGGTPACVTTPLNGAIAGSYDVDSGDMSLDVPVRGRIHIGYSLGHPCPLCEDNVCEGGQRDGLACSVDGSDALFGAVSYDCPPSSGANISGNGLATTLEFTTGAASMPFGTKCDAPLGALDCACAVCSSDSTVVCNSNAECAAQLGDSCFASADTACAVNADCSSVDVGPCHTGIHRCLGNFSFVCNSNTDCLNKNVGPCASPTCNDNGSGSSRRPNDCNDGVCSPQPGSPGDGVCNAGPTDSWCDGRLRSNGKGLIPCFDDSDCAAYQSGSPDPANWVCPNDDCGACTVDTLRECFLNPIAGSGTPGERMVGVGCLGATANSGVNAAIGLPGAYRAQQNVSFEGLLCSDGVTPFYPPGGSNCP